MTTQGEPGRRKTGPKPLVDDEVYDLCFELYATRGWSYDCIAEHLFNKHGVASPTDASRPVHRSTILRWIEKGSQQLSEEGAYRRQVESVLAGRELDDLKELLYDQRSMHLVNSFDDVLKFIDMALRIRKERATTFGIYAPKQKEITYSGELDLKGLDPETEQMLAALEQHVQANRARRQGNGEP